MSKEVDLVSMNTTTFPTSTFTGLGAMVGPHLQRPSINAMKIQLNPQPQTNTLSPIIMEVENCYIWKLTILLKLPLERPIFDFHEYGRNCKTNKFKTEHQTFKSIQLPMIVVDRELYKKNNSGIPNEKKKHIPWSHLFPKKNCKKSLGHQQNQSNHHGFPMVFPQQNVKRSNPLI